MTTSTIAAVKAVHPMSGGAALLPALALALAMAAALVPQQAKAGERLLGTWGVQQVEGAGGGGLTPWATITGTGSSDQVGGSVVSTYVSTQDDYQLRVVGAGIGINNRVELSMANWSFKISPKVVDHELKMNVVGLKIRVTGDAVYDQDTWMPQVSVGAQYKMASDNSLFAVLNTAYGIGIRRDEDVDLYVSATKVWLGALAGRNVLGNVTLRWTRANQFGLLGFGGGAEGSHTLQVEGSLGVMLRDNLVLGAEYRTKPDNFSVPGFEEEAAWDIFAAWFPHRNVSFTAAWLDLGNIVTQKKQHGLYLSGQVVF